MMTLPEHLKKYIVQQNYEKYTPVDQAVWRYILRQLKSYLSKHAHAAYVDGLEKTGIDVEEIPRIENISVKLSKFGWRALPVSGFIPPAAFMELQSLGVLPIASDMRSIDHLQYTPAPDIVHEAAGHAPILIEQEFADYLREYAQVAKKAIISSEDLALYEAIRILSDIKENPNSTKADVEQAQKSLEQVSKNISHISEAAELARMNWWTAEYGLIGDANNPKIYGAGLLSSVGEAKWCLSEKVKKIPLTINCIQTSYDITEPQPQLFVTPGFQHLKKVLNEFSQTMAFKTGGIRGLNKALKAKSVNTVELNTGLQISGILSDFITSTTNNSEVIYLKFSGPCQLSKQDKELQGHSKKYHSHGYSTPLGKFSGHLEVGSKAKLKFESGVLVEGTLRSKTDLLLTFDSCLVTYNNQILFEPSWGPFDMALGENVTSVFAGPADRKSFGESDDFKALQVPAPSYSAEQIKKHEAYQKIRDLRKNKITGQDLENRLAPIVQNSNNDWLLLLEAFELVTNRCPESALKNQLLQKLEQIKKNHPEKTVLIDDGLALAKQL